LFTGSTTAYVVLRGFTIDAYNATYSAIKITLASATGSAHHIRLTDLTITNTHESGILITGAASTNNEIIHVNVHDSGNTSNPNLPPFPETPAHYHGIYVSTSNNLIERSDFHNNPGCGIHVYAGNDTANANVVRSNRTYDNGVWADHGCG